MAKRLCFLVNDNNEVEERFVDFEYVKGMAFSQRVKCANSLANAIKVLFPEKQHLEVSTKSLNELGKKLSAFNLMLDGYYVESIFQSSKVFNKTTQYHFLIDKPPLEAKKYIKENGSGQITSFNYQNIEYPTNPKSAFYDWIYINALSRSDLAEEVMTYDIFTDIEFNDQKSINCQARAVALFVAMCRANKKDYYLSSFDSFITIYAKQNDQISLF